MNYKNHYLTNVIFRLDFAIPIESLKKAMPEELKMKCVEYFPIFEQRKLFSKQVRINQDKLNQETVILDEEVSEWHFFGGNREKELCITSNCIFVDYKAYQSFDIFMSEFDGVYNMLKTLFPNLVVNRIGLRHIDQISIDNEKPFDKTWFDFWSDYINEDLLAGLKFVDDSIISRQMNTTDLNYNDHILHFQYGIFNEDYPAVIKKKLFILDTDAYVSGKIDLEDVDKFAERLHEESIEIFEKSITKKLREKMVIVDES